MAHTHQYPVEMVREVLEAEINKGRLDFYVQFLSSGHLPDALIARLAISDFRHEWADALRDAIRAADRDLGELKRELFAEKAHVGTEITSLERRRNFNAFALANQERKLYLLEQRDRYQSALAQVKDTNADNLKRDVATLHAASEKMLNYLTALLNEQRSAPVAEQDADWINELESLLGEVRNAVTPSQNPQLTASPDRRGKVLQ